MKKIHFTPIEGRSKLYYAAVVFFAILGLLGLYVTYLMYDKGLGYDHPILGKLTGMSSRVPWGLGIVMAIFYIGVSAGSLVISALSAVFGQKEYKPFSRMGVYLSILLIVAALTSIILDWGRPDRIVNPFIYLNPTSMFSINSFLYSAYMFIGFIYLLAMFADKEVWVKRLGLLAVFWAVLVHSGTGYILAVAPRELMESPLLPPSFVAAALSSGTALIILTIQIVFKATKRYLDMELIKGLSRLLAVFIIVVFYFILIENLFRLYLPKTSHAEHYFLFGDPYNQSIHHYLFWGGLILVGTIIPLLILNFEKTKHSIKAINIASIFVVLGILCERYVLVIPGQTLKPDLLPGTSIATKMVDTAAQTLHGYAKYTISNAEIIQAVGIASLVIVAFMLGMKWFRFMPMEAKAISGELGNSHSSEEEK